MSKASAFVLMTMLAPPARGREHDDLPLMVAPEPPAPEIPPEDVSPAPRKKGWAMAALRRGYYTGRMTTISTQMALGSLIGARSGARMERLADAMTHWAQRIHDNEIPPVRPGKMKNLAQGLLFMAGYVGPVIALGTAMTVGIGMLASGGIAAAAAIGTTCLINTHQAAGEAFLQTARSRADISLRDKDTLTAALADPQFRRVAHTNVLIKSGISLAFTAVAGPVARLFGGFSNEMLRMILSYTHLDRVIGRELVRSLEHTVLKSTSVKVGQTLANLSIRNGKGSDRVSRAFNAVAGAARAVTAWTVGGVKPVTSETPPPAPAQAEFTQAAAAPHMDVPTGLRLPPPVICAQQQTAMRVPQPL